MHSTKHHKNCHSNSNVHCVFRTTLKTLISNIVKCNSVSNMASVNRNIQCTDTSPKPVTQINNNIYWSRSCHAQLPSVSSYILLYLPQNLQVANSVV